MSGYDVLICTCPEGPYLGARKMGTPCCCERCGFITADQWNHIVSGVQTKVLADKRAKTRALPERADAHTEECPGRPGYRGICTCEGDILISRAAVLALLDEEES